MVKIFISYAHADAFYKQELEKHLAALRRNGEIAPWTDTMISPSETWDKSISTALNEADIIICLLSSDYINSNYCYEFEMKDALNRNKENKTKVIPIIIRSCDWSDTPFAELQALPLLGKPIKEWADQDQAFLNVVEGLKKSIRATSRDADISNNNAAGTVTEQNKTKSIFDDPEENTTAGKKNDYPEAASGPTITKRLSEKDEEKEHAPKPFHYTRQSHRRKFGKTAFILVAVALIIIFVLVDMADKNNIREMVSGEKADEVMSKWGHFTDFLKRYEWSELLIVCIIGTIGGWIAGSLIEPYSANLLLDVLIGVTGGFVGSRLFGHLLHITGNVWADKILTATAGALILDLILKFIRQAMGRADR